MNLREKIEKEITDKVMTKLASERVELVSKDELKRVLSLFKKMDKETGAKLKEAEDLYESSAREYTGIYNKMNAQLDKVKEDAEAKAKIISKEHSGLTDPYVEIRNTLIQFRKKAKALGLDPENNPNYAKANKLFEDRDYYDESKKRMYQIENTIVSKIMRYNR